MALGLVGIHIGYPRALEDLLIDPGIEVGTGAPRGRDDSEGEGCGSQRLKGHLSRNGWDFMG